MPRKRATARPAVHPFLNSSSTSCLQASVAVEDPSVKSKQTKSKAAASEGAEVTPAEISSQRLPSNSQNEKIKECSIFVHWAMPTSSFPLLNIMGTRQKPFSGTVAGLGGSFLPLLRISLHSAGLPEQDLLNHS